MDLKLDGAIIDKRYSVVKKIQSGAFGSTWLAKDCDQSKNVCIKTFFSDGKSQRRELLVLKEIASGHFYHDNLCCVLDVSEEKAPIKTSSGDIITRAHYVVFEYCSGTDLFNFLVTGPFEKRQRVSSFPEPLAQHYFTQLLLAVTYLHERGVFHRDIKPENCVLDDNFNLKLTDFGTNKILTLSEVPGQALRTNTKRIGTDSYRAPEINGVSSYDPSLADIWSLGVTLFFMVGLEDMVQKVQVLDQYARQVVAPLGILFPFPFHCSKLDSYMKSSDPPSIASVNCQFWTEWCDLHSKLSSDCVDLLNRIFQLTPSQRILVRDILQHPWVSLPTRLSPDEIVRQMWERCPGCVNPANSATPQVLASQILGGVDQATLRSTLTCVNDDHGYPLDSEVWVYSNNLFQLEAAQVSILKATDIQDFIVDVSFCRNVLMDIVKNPQSHELRCILSRQVPISWINSFLLAIGFLPQQKFLYLSLDHLNLHLVSYAIAILDGLEQAVFRSVVAINSDDSVEMPICEPVMHSLPTHVEGLPQGGMLPLETVCDQKPDEFVLRKYSSDPNLYIGHVTMVTTDGSNSSSTSTPKGESSQESLAWTQYTGSSWSGQSSQEECPGDIVPSLDHDHSQSHKLLKLPMTISPLEASSYRASSIFCKLSGLLTSYGLYQVVVHQNLALYCRGRETSFSVRIVLTQPSSGEVSISSCCFCSQFEWNTILSRLTADMTEPCSMLADCEMDRDT